MVRTAVLTHRIANDNRARALPSARVLLRQWAPGCVTARLACRARSPDARKRTCRGGTRWRSTRRATAARGRAANEAARTIRGARAPARATKAGASTADAIAIWRSRAPIVIVTANRRVREGSDSNSRRMTRCGGSTAADRRLPLIASIAGLCKTYQAPCAMATQVIAPPFRTTDLRSHINKSARAPQPALSSLGTGTSQGDAEAGPLAISLTHPAITPRWYRVCRGWWRRLHPHGTGASCRTRRIVHL
jgi:hypothetical protein